MSFRALLDRRMAGTERVGEHDTSMLPDMEAGESPETDALIVAAVGPGVLAATPRPPAALSMGR